MVGDWLTVLERGWWHIVGERGEGGQPWGDVGERWGVANRAGEGGVAHHRGKGEGWPTVGERGGWPTVVERGVAHRGLGRRSAIIMLIY